MQSGNYTMRLTDEIIKYKIGQPIVFDDSYEHEVIIYSIQSASFNFRSTNLLLYWIQVWAEAPNANEPRVLLIIDVVHPVLRA